MAIWLLAALSMKTPPAVKSKMYHLEEMTKAAAKNLSTRLGAVAGVREAVVLADEGLVILKVDMQQSYDEAEVLRLIAAN